MSLFRAVGLGMVATPFIAAFVLFGAEMGFLTAFGILAFSLAVTGWIVVGVGLLHR